MGYVFLDIFISEYCGTQKIEAGFLSGGPPPIRISFPRNLLYREVGYDYDTPMSSSTLEESQLESEHTQKIAKAGYFTFLYFPFEIQLLIRIDS